MRRLLLFSVFALLLSPIFGQHQLQHVSRDASVQALSSDRNSGWISWATEANLTQGIVNTDATDPFDLACVQRFAASDLTSLDGTTLTQVAFYLWSSDEYPAGGTYSIRVYQGGSYNSSTSMNPGNLVASQTVPSVNIDDWTVVTLNTPVTIDATKELWFGVYISNGTGLLLSYDESNVTAGKGTLYYDPEDQTWYDINAIGLSFTVGNWGLMGYVNDPNGDDPIIDLGIWYIDNVNDQNEITSMTVPYGSNFTPIPIVYNYNYGAATYDFQDTLHFEMTIDGTPLGSTGASTTYIASGNGVYWTGFNALYASDIATYNLYGTHTFCMTVSTGPGWFENDPSDNTGCMTVTFEAPPASQSYVITVLNNDGTILPSGSVSVTAGGSQTFIISPQPCQTISDVLVDGVSVLPQVTNNMYTFTNVMANHTFQVLYTTQTFALSASTDGNGTVTPTSMNAQCGGSQTFTITPNTGYVINYVTDNTMDVTSSVVNNVYTISNINIAHTIYVAFTPTTSTPCDIPTNVTVDENGNICWGGTAASWNVLYNINGGADQTVAVSVPCFQVPGLADGDVVTYSIQAFCGGTAGSSAWTPAQTFTYDAGGGNPDDPDDPEDGVAEYHVIALTLYPNPADNVLHVRCGQPMERVELCNLAGQRLQLGSVDAATAEFNVTNLAAGIYFVRAFADGQTLVRKFVKR